MIIHNREKPIFMEKMEILLGRLPSTHPSVRAIESELYKVRAGFHGEKEVDYHLRELDRPGIFILHDLRLKTTTGSFFQIDTLILTESEAIILEIKNYAGPLTYDTQTRQLIRPPDVMPNPFFQVRRQQNHLQNFLLSEQLSHFPTKAFVVFANPQARLSIEPPDDKISHLLLYPSELSSKISNSSKRLSGTELTRLVTPFKKLNRPLDLNVLSHFHVDPAAIMHGIRCPQCGMLEVSREYSSWRCRGCLSKTKYAHFQALYDYSLLFGNQLTVKQTMNFLQMTSRFTAQRLLSQVSIRDKRVYHLDLNLLRLRK
ncbi:NERD domain-containing protein [Domibacillus sp. A3M-37]|uniref:nuclease-related domain-containing protein n=1 Tax=Domibacillus sp. A3M-37 TaxID=2962037 RepID=UPI0020B655BB|nr:nuclease-related domain-containing protein [Domibacillus sp. A3M-37]MCP3761419.1 NERD domain-containing protein [Domibacillus sp. A3M-37]